MLKLSKILMFAAITILGLIGCVKIETGATVEEVTESNEVRAKQIRTQWADQLSRIYSEQEKAIVLKEHIDSVTAVYIRYGVNVANEWRKGNEGRSQVIEASEMRQVVEAWVKTQRPILMAYEDNMEYGLRLLKDSRSSEPLPMKAYDLLDSMANQYYDTYNAVFYPNDNVDYYEEELLKAERRNRNFVEQFDVIFR